MVFDLCPIGYRNPVNQSTVRQCHLPNLTGNIARFSFKRQMVVIKKRHAVALYDAAAFLLLPRTRDITDDEIDADDGSTECFRDVLEQLSVVGMHLVRHIGRRAAKTPIHFLVKRRAPTLLRNGRGRKILPRQLRARGLVELHGRKIGSAARGMFVRLCDQLGNRAPTVSDDMRLIPPETRNEDAVNECRAKHEAYEFLLYDGEGCHLF